MALAVSAPRYELGDCLCGYGWVCKKTGCRLGSQLAPSQYSIYYRELRKIKIRLAVDRCVAQIPFRLAHRIQEIRFGPDGVIDPHFEVVYMGGKVIEFENVDTFPTDADIARIALDCP